MTPAQIVRILRDMRGHIASVYIAREDISGIMAVAREARELHDAATRRVGAAELAAKRRTTAEKNLSAAG